MSVTNSISLEKSKRHPIPVNIYVASTAILFLLAAVGFAYFSSGPSQIDDAAVEQLLQWLQANGAQISGIEIVPDGFGGRDVRSTRPIHEGEALIVLPRSLMLSQDVCHNDTTVQTAQAFLPEISQTEKLAVFLLANRNASFWTPFINILPKSIPLPIFWDDDDLQWLQLPHFIESVTETKQALASSFEAIREALPNVTLREFMHSWALVASRAWGFTFDGGQQDVLVPLFDMANHEPTGIMASLSDDQDSAVLIANRDHGIGAFIHTYYSNHSNFIFLNTYGFTLEGTDEHMLCSFEDEDQAWQLGRDIGADSGFQKFMKKHRALSVTETNNALDHEILALEKLYISIESIQTELTTLEEDELLLRDTTTTLNQRNAIRARRQEKLCWRSLKQLAQAATDVIFNPDTRPAFQEQFSDWDGYDSYGQHLDTLLA